MTAVRFGSLYKAMVLSERPGPENPTVLLDLMRANPAIVQPVVMEHAVAADEAKGLVNWKLNENHTPVTAHPAFLTGLVKSGWLLVSTAKEGLELIPRLFQKADLEAEGAAQASLMASGFVTDSPFKNVKLSPDAVEEVVSKFLSDKKLSLESDQDVPRLVIPLSTVARLLPPTIPD